MHTAAAFVALCFCSGAGPAWLPASLCPPREQANLLAKRENATNVRETTTKAVAQALDETAIKKRLAAEAKRNDSRQWAREKAVNGYELVVRAKAGKKAVRAHAALTTRSLAAITRSRRHIHRLARWPW